MVGSDYDPNVLAHQRFLRASGLYQKASLDGIMGSKTVLAINQFTQKSAELVVPEVAIKMGASSVRNIRSLILQAQVHAWRFFSLAAEKFPYLVKCVSGFRSWYDQDALYAQGRTAPGAIVTKAMGGFSYHNFGIAWDVGVFSEKGQYITKEGPYRDLAAIILPEMDHEISWGGHFPSGKSGLVDLPHWQVKIPVSIITLRGRYQDGADLFV